MSEKPLKKTSFEEELAKSILDRCKNKTFPEANQSFADATKDFILKHLKPPKEGDRIGVMSHHDLIPEFYYEESPLPVKFVWPLLGDDFYYFKQATYYKTGFLANEVVKALLKDFEKNLEVGRSQTALHEGIVLFEKQAHPILYMSFAKNIEPETGPVELPTLKVATEIIRVFENGRLGSAIYTQELFRKTISATSNWFTGLYFE